MEVQTAKYIRKPLYVDVVRITSQNFDAVASWCQGEVLNEEVPGKDAFKPFIKVRVHNPKNSRQTQAFIGDWLLYTERGYKVYTNKAFLASFDRVTPEEAPLSDPRLTGDPTVDMYIEPDIDIPQRRMIEPGATTPQGEPIELVPATPQAIADVVREQQPKEPGLQRAALTAGYPIDPEEASVEERIVAPGQVETPDVGVSSGPTAPPKGMGLVRETVHVPPPVGQSESVVEQDPEDAAAGKRVLSQGEQQKLLPEEIRELLKTGNYVLAQDLASE